MNKLNLVAIAVTCLCSLTDSMAAVFIANPMIDDSCKVISGAKSTDSAVATLVKQFGSKSKILSPASNISDSGRRVAIMELPSDKNNGVDQVSIIDGDFNQCYEIVDVLRRKIKKMIPEMANTIDKLKPVPVWIQLGKDTVSVYYTDNNSMRIDSAGLLNLTMKRIFSKPQISEDGYKFVERRAGISLNCRDHTYAVTATGLFNINNEIVHVYGMNGEFEPSKLIYSRTNEEDGALHSLTTHCEALSDIAKQTPGLSPLKIPATQIDQSSVNASKNARKAHQDGNAVIEYCESADTTLERKKRESAALNRNYRFEGSIFDIKTEREIVVRLSSGHYADVFLTTDEGSLLRKNQAIKFNGVLGFIGSGVIVKHVIKQALVTAQ